MTFMPKQHFVVIKGSDGEAELHPFKVWLRQHPEHLPKGLTTSNTSHRLRSGLQKDGWKLYVQTDRALVVRPDEKGDVSFASDLLEEEAENPYGDEEDKVEESEEITFKLERDLQSALRTHIEQLEPGLEIIDGDKERITDIGRIDITARDKLENIVILELKAGTASSEVIAQILAYMGAIGESDRKPVRGILVAGDFQERVIFAAQAVPNLQLKKYSFRFIFADAKREG